MVLTRARCYQTAMLALLMLAAATAVTPTPDWARSYIADTLHVTDYRAATVDLNGDGQPEVLVYVTGAGQCGSGGCDLFVLSRAAGHVMVVTDISITRPPIRVLSTSSHGWRDLSVLVAGGGIIPGYSAQLRFDGRGYPSNPTVPPAEPMHRAGGRIVLDELPLRPAQLDAR